MDIWGREQGELVRYWYSAGTGQEPLYVAGQVVPMAAMGASGCGRVGPGPGLHDGGLETYDETLVSSTWSALHDARAAHLTVDYLLKSLVDGGNTEGLVQQVQQTWPQEAWELREALLAKSPFLSTEVLIGTMQRNIMPQSMLLEVCLANPEATRRRGFMQYAELDAPAPLPGYMLDLIEASWQPRTFRAELEAQLGSHSADVARSARTLVQLYGLDTAGANLSGMRQAWQAVPEYGARFSEVSALVRMEALDSALALVQGLGDRYVLKAGRADEQVRTVWYLEELQRLADADRGVMHLDSAEVAAWEAFAETVADVPGQWARNVLCTYYDKCITGPTVPPMPKARRISTGPSGPQPAPVLTLAPNPANSWMAINYKVDQPAGELHVRMVDATGREVYRRPLDRSEGQVVWDTRPHPAGVYLVELYNESTRLCGERAALQGH